MSEILDVLSSERSRLANRRTERMTIREYLEGCRTDPMRYATAAQRMLAAIGEPTVVDTQTANAAKKRTRCFSAAPRTYP